MDPLSQKKRPGGDIESPFAAIRKSPKPALTTATPYASQVLPGGNEELSPDDKAKVRDKSQQLHAQAA